MQRLLIWQKLASCICGRLILAAVCQSSLHLSDLPLINTWEHQEKGKKGWYFEKMFLKAAYFQTNHSLAAEHIRWGSHSRKKYFGTVIINKFYLGHMRLKSSQHADIKQVRVVLLFRLLEATGWSLSRRQWWLNQKVKADHAISNISLGSKGPQGQQHLLYYIYLFFLNTQDIALFFWLLGRQKK